MTRRSTPKGKPGRMPTNPVDPPLQRRRLIAAGVLLPVLIVGAIPFLTSSPWAPPTDRSAFDYPHCRDTTCITGRHLRWRLNLQELP